MSNFLPPMELSKSLINVGIKKAKHPLVKMIILGMLAGVYIGFASHLATTVATVGSTLPVWFGLKKLLVGAVFSVGLMLVMIPGSELFTGNCLMTVALAEKKITFMAMMRNWVVVWVANLIGSVLLAFMIIKLCNFGASPVGVTAVKIANSKASLDAMAMVFRGVAANWLVCLAVMMALSAKDIAGKVLAIFFPIMAFVASGFEHSIANMYFLPAGLFAQSMNGTAASALTVTNSVINIGLVTIGNIIGGALFVGMVYWYLYVKDAPE